MSHDGRLEMKRSNNTIDKNNNRSNKKEKVTSYRCSYTDNDQHHPCKDRKANNERLSDKKGDHESMTDHNSNRERLRESNNRRKCGTHIEDPPVKQ